MTEKPEALRLAEFYEALAEEPPKSPDNSKIRAAAAGLRRLSAVEAQRDALLEALKKIAAIGNKMWGTDWEEIEEARGVARAAIKAVEEQK